VTNVQFAGDDAAWEKYGPPIDDALAQAGVAADLSRDHDPARVDYIVMGGGVGIEDFTPYSRARAVLRLWAGVEDIVGNDTLTIPLARMVGGGLDEGMRDWVVAHVMRHHVGMDAHLHGQDGVWRGDVTPKLARDRRVTILGLGALGQVCGRALAGLDFAVAGWSRSRKQVEGIRCLAGEDGLAAALADAEIVVLLLPSTPETAGLLDARRLAMLPRGAVIVNPGRGTLIDDDALDAALDSGQVAHATLDTFRQEPLRDDHRWWSDPRVTVTPHIASETRAPEAAAVIAENIRRGEAGEPFLHLVDRDAGY